MTKTAEQKALQAARNEIAGILRKTRRSMGLGVRELAKKAKVAPSAVTEIEQDQIVMGPVTTLRLVHALDMDVKTQQQFIMAAKQASSRVHEIWDLMQEVMKEN